MPPGSKLDTLSEVVAQPSISSLRQCLVSLPLYATEQAEGAVVSSLQFQRLLPARRSA
jgi:hypothetical protein